MAKTSMYTWLGNFNAFYTYYVYMYMFIVNVQSSVQLSRLLIFKFLIQNRKSRLTDLRWIFNRTSTEYSFLYFYGNQQAFIIYVSHVTNMWQTRFMTILWAIGPYMNKRLHHQIRREVLLFFFLKWMGQAHTKKNLDKLKSFKE